jgi:non-ribosomal peptide synthetase component F
VPENREHFIDDAFEAPKDSLESLVAKIQAEVLDIDRVGRLDSFYDFGGTSLQAIRICARVERDLGCKALPVWLFESDVLADFVQRLDVTSVMAPEPVAPAARHQLSFAQQRLWLAGQFAPDSTDYSAFELHRMTGELDVPALQAAFADVIGRHPTLRTTFHEQDGVPYQRVARDFEAPCEVIPLTSENSANVREAIERRMRVPFRLEADVLVRLTLMRTDSAHHLVLLVVHHIVIDDWSLAVFWRDLAAFYVARTRGLPADLGSLPVQYADYAALQRASLQGENLDAYLDYWREQLDGARLQLDLPTDFPRSEPRETSDAVAAFALPAPAAQAVAKMAAEARATTFMVLLAAFSVTVSSLAGQDDLVIGTFAANRNSVELEDLVGLFVNLLPLRIQCIGDLTFSELLAQVRSTALDAFRHQELPFDQLVAALRPSRDLTRHPVFQVAIQTFGSRASRLRFPGIDSVLLEEGQGGNTLDLLMTVEEAGDGLSGELHYRAALFSPSTADKLAARFAAIVTLATSHPNLTLAELTT